MADTQVVALHAETREALRRIRTGNATEQDGKALALWLRKTADYVVGAGEDGTAYAHADGRRAVALQLLRLMEIE